MIVVLWLLGCVGSEATLHADEPVAVCELGPGDDAVTCVLFDCEAEGDEVRCPGLTGFGVLVADGF